MSAVEDLSRRRGGREARKALRSRPIPMAEAAVRPGMAAQLSAEGLDKPVAAKVLRALKSESHLRTMNRVFGGLFVAAGTLLALFKRTT